MKVQSVSRTNTGSSSAIVINTNTNPCNIGFGVVVTSGTPTYTVQHTFDDPAVGFTTWFDHPTVSGETTNQDGNYAFPVTAVKVVISSGTGVVTMNLVQAGIA
jgi:hypothetical protein